MNDENVERETDSEEVGAEQVDDQPGTNITIEGEIVSSRSDLTNTSPQVQPSIGRAILGGMVLLSDELSGLTSTGDDDEVPREEIEAALRRAAQQQASTEDQPYANLRYGAIGMLGGALDGTQQGAGRFSSLANKVSRISGKVVGPVWNSFALKPVRKPVMRVEQAAEEKVDEWIERGRVEEVRSRALAEVGINNFVDNSVTEIAENERVKMIVQQVIDGQGTGFLTEIIGQIRQRIVSLDLLWLGKLKREQVAAPDFRDAYLRRMTEKRPQYHRVDLNSSLAGTYAGPLGRITAFMIDFVLFLITAGVVSSFISSTLAMLDLRDNVISFMRSGGLLPIITLIIIVNLNFLVIGVYFIASWYLVGSTPGDLILGIRVVNKEGEHVSFWHSFLRLIGMIISTVFLFVGYIWALFDRRRQGWHDKLGGTFVIYDWPAESGGEPQQDQVADGSASEG